MCDGPNMAQNPIGAIDISPDELDVCLSAMTDEERAKAEEIISEMERRQREEGIRYYVPYDDPGYQLDAHKCPAKLRMIIGSNRSGKTHFLGTEAVWTATGKHPHRKMPKPPVSVRWVTTDFLNGIEKIALTKIKELVCRKDLKGRSWDRAYSKSDRVLHFTNGSRIEFMSYDQDVEKFEGAKRHLIIEDEPCPIDIHNANMARLVDYNGDMVMGMTPVNLDARTSWTYDLWLKINEGTIADAACFHFDIAKNRSLPKDYVDKFIDSVENEEERMARVEGKFPKLLGLVYKKFSREKHVIKLDAPPKPSTIFISMDAHTREKTAILFGAVDKEGNKYVWEEIYQVGRAKELIDLINQKLAVVGMTTHKGTVRALSASEYRFGFAIADNSIKEKNEVLGGMSIQSEFLDPDRDNSENGIYFLTVSNKEKDVRAGIRMVESHLGLDELYQKPRLFISGEGCPITIRQFQGYVWDDYKHAQERNKRETPKKKDDHLMDALRYWLMANPTFIKARKEEETNYKHQHSYLNKYAAKV